MPGNYRDWVVMSFKTIELFIWFTYIVDFDLLVLARSQKPVAIYWVPAHLIDNIIMSWNSMNSFATCSWIPKFDETIFATSQDKTFKWMPITTFNIRSVVTKAKLLFTCRKVKNFCSAIIGAWEKFKTWIWKRKISNAGAAVSLVLIFLRKFYVWIYYITFFVCRNNKLIIICHTYSLNRGFTMNWTLTSKSKFRLCIPLKYFTFWCACYQILSVFNPFYCKKWLHIFVSTFSNKLRSTRFPIFARICKIVWVVEFIVSVVRQYYSSIFCIEVVGCPLPIITIDCVNVVPAWLGFWR